MADLTNVLQTYDPRQSFAEWYQRKQEYDRARSVEFATRQNVVKYMAQLKGVDITVNDYSETIDLGNGYAAKVVCKFKVKVDQGAAQAVINDWFKRGLGDVAKKVFKTEIKVSQTELRKLPDNLRREASDCLIEEPAPGTITIEKSNSHGIGWDK